MIVGGRLEKRERFGRQLIKRTKDVNVFYKSESKINRVNISHDIQ